MVTQTKRTKRQRRSSLPQRLEERGMDILKNGEIVPAGSLYLVQSQSDTDTYYDVRYELSVWRCNCAYYTSGHTRCKHIYAVFALLFENNDNKLGTCHTHIEEPQIRCPECDSDKFRECERYDTKAGETIRFRCCNVHCKKRFTFNPGFKRRHYSDNIITDALIDAAAGKPPSRIVEKMEKNKIYVSERTIRRWIDDYSELIEAYTEIIKFQTSGRWSVDEVYVAGGGKKKKTWLVKIMDNVTRRIITWEISYNKPGYDATGLLFDAMQKALRTPEVLIADGLAGFKKGFRNAIQNIDEEARLLSDVGIRGIHINNNKHERLNGEIKACIRRARGFRADFPGLVRLHLIYHNFVHKHGGLNGRTPAEASGVYVAGPDILSTLIQNAALYVA